MHFGGVSEAIYQGVANYVGNFTNEKGKHVEFKLLRKCKLG